MKDKLFLTNVLTFEKGICFVNRWQCAALIFIAETKCSSGIWLYLLACKSLFSTMHRSIRVFGLLLLTYVKYLIPPGQILQDFCFAFGLSYLWPNISILFYFLIAKYWIFGLKIHTKIHTHSFLKFFPNVSPSIYFPFSSAVVNLVLTAGLHFRKMRPGNC